MRRHMKHAASFVTYKNGRPLPFSWPDTREHIIGWYHNPPPWEQVRLVFTNCAIYVGDESAWTRIALDDITDYELPRPKERASGVRIVTRDGIRFVRIAGRSGKGAEFIDAFALVGLLHAYLRAMHHERRGPS